MATQENHWKLGLFVVTGLALALVTVTFLGAWSLQNEVKSYVSFFDESVQGLEVGSPIKFRGVTIGKVDKIRVARDHRHVEVESELSVEQLDRLGLDISKEQRRFVGAPDRLEMSTELRLQLASAGLTGLKFLQLDFFDPKRYPPPSLPFKVPQNTIPTAPSMMKDLGDSLTLIANLLPEIVEQTASIMGEIEVMVRDVSERQLTEQISSVVLTLNEVLATTQSKLAGVDTGGISRDAKRSLRSIDAAALRLDQLLARIEQKGGLLSSVERATGAVGDTLREADGLGNQLINTLEAIESAARSLRMFTGALEQDPDMLLKGRRPQRKR